MIIKIDEKEILVSDPNKNIVEIGLENGITITAPCFRSKEKHGCCKACVIEIDGVQKYACGTKPQDGMNIIYDRDDLANIRKERRREYAKAVKNNHTGNNSCCGTGPQNTTKKTSSCCCSSNSCSEETGNKVSVEYLYLDLQTCDRCIGTDKVLDEVMITLTPALELAGYKVEYNKIEMKTVNLAIKYKFLSSPTIKVNGKDICTSVQENSCRCCSDISEADVDCRVFEHNGKSYEVPPKEMLANDILCKVFGEISEDCSCETEYELPDNLKIFYQGKKNTGCY